MREGKDTGKDENLIIVITHEWCLNITEKIPSLFAEMYIAHLESWIVLDRKWMMWRGRQEQK